jgi:hypothetical protein
MKPSSFRQSPLLGAFLLATLLGSTGLAQAQVVGDRVIPCNALCRRWLGLEERPVYRDRPVYRALPSFRERVYLEDDGYYLEEREPRMRVPRERRELWSPQRGFERAPAGETFVRSKRPRQTVSSHPKSTITKSKKVASSPKQIADRRERLKDTGALAGKVTSPPAVEQSSSQDPVTPAADIPTRMEPAPAVARSRRLLVRNPSQP